MVFVCILGIRRRFSGQSLIYYMVSDLNAKGLWQTVYGKSYMIFSVQACHDAIIYLTEVSKGASNPR